jgi:hypothetical protein
VWLVLLWDSRSDFGVNLFGFSKGGIVWNYSVFCCLSFVLMVCDRLSEVLSVFPLTGFKAVPSTIC